VVSEFCLASLWPCSLLATSGWPLLALLATKADGRVACWLQTEKAVDFFLHFAGQNCL
jgi:hypothetical protein